MAKNKIKFNLIDWLIVLFVVLFLGLIAIAWFWPKEELSKKATLGLRVTENAQAIKSTVVAGQKVFLNGSNNSAQIKSVEGSGESILIKITAPAEKNAEVYNFNGQRVLIGQKAELHGSFFVRATIESFDYEE